jgi:hypothetical protein
MQANFIQHQGYTIVYRRYASLFFIVGIDSSQVCSSLITLHCEGILIALNADQCSCIAAAVCYLIHLGVQSPMMVWEFIHRLVEMLNRTFENVSELDIMINSALV